MASKLGNITFDCADPRTLSYFWADVFGYPHKDWPPEMRAELLSKGLTEDDLDSRGVAEDPAGEGPRLFFQRVPEGKTAKNRMHIDVRANPERRATAEQLVAEKDRVVALGATVVVEFNTDWGPFEDHHFVMQDPEGNEFCIQ
jgi:catechol 2,3-dioxygenase-like lactoylglutathione lyase family enzyme